MVIKTNRLIIKRIHPQEVASIAPLLKYQSLFRQAGLISIGEVDLTSLQLLCHSECVLQIKTRNEQQLLGLITLLHTYGESGKVFFKRYELGYLLIPLAQHCGYMTEAINAVCQELDKYSIKLVAETKKNNKSSKQVLKRCGFIPMAMKTGISEYWER
ncbi:GNAT family N-acetyltransferase [Limosilactobacillus fastidiosus]|uniref:GNAT family N-acetyltransferase n=1 Tax=Limosilactobacillus fastidiosus TaxID=2759855 RepID=A0A7W3YCC9_9LACO|nr:GNAT family N-acetyltransferase [Limosilactobacillus fastidiosus]MBB1063352.1 GNAT family N-acetyltransferase [Limosilactobacillus fastidiosus]MBB1085966.1 GNAT family N-acetyltransferase [Limosilactobacillus fastidiosus]MCD7084621.1 GNAT family N-acetyltransferase [Limosilactobacillus fastidiosus]MCD7085697.1 GNAT family N-acetyltransferase [Limosilactobacillus fastidiosus]MCD7114095.1 GNAT family N-acetyltransferase [Limosilactobacillus fastidiosus]